MYRHRRCAAILMTHEVMRAIDSDYGESRALKSPHHFAPAQTGKTCHRLDRHALHADEFSLCAFVALDLDTKLDGFANAFHQFVERTRLRVTAWQLRNAGDVVTFPITLDDDTVFAFCFTH